MSRRSLILTLGFLIAAGAVTAASAPGSSADERIILVAQPGAGKEDREIRSEQARVKLNPGQAGNYERLGWAYVAKARRTLDAGYYKLAEKTADAMAARFGSSPSELLLRGHVMHNLHRFHEAEAIARQLVRTRAASSDFALLSDALMEQGRIAAAVDACQREMNLRPGLEAYGRAAHLRWLTGDLPGAIEMMTAAVHASSPADPANCAWVVSRLSGYELQAGHAPRALELADAALKVASDYPLALFSRGKALAALGRGADAVVALERAAQLNPLPEYQWWLADALRTVGRGADAAAVETKIDLRGEAADPRTYALYLATRGFAAHAVWRNESRGASGPAWGGEVGAAGQRVNSGAPGATLARSATRLNTAVRLATEELQNRRDVLTQDALAWALAAAGDLPAADAAMRLALADKTSDARLFLHAGEIARARGDLAAARRYFAAAAPLAETLTPAENSLLRRDSPAPGPVALR